MAAQSPVSPLKRFLTRLVARPGPPPPAARDLLPTASSGAVMGRESWNLGGIPFFRPYQSIPLVESYSLYEKFQEAVPLIDSAIVHTIEAVGTPCIEADEDVKADIEEWLDRLIVNRVQTGLGPFLETWLGNMLTYGRAHAEIVLTNARDDIYSINQLHPATIGFVPSSDGVTLQTVQFGGQTPLVFPDWKIMNCVNRVRGDNPNGTSLLWGISLVAECYVTMVRSQQGLYTRFGDPSYHFNITPPDNLNDPNGAIMGRLVSDMRAQFQDLIASRRNGQTKDIFSVACEANILGAAGEELNFPAAAIEIVDQLITKFGLPPLIYGLSRSTTERMSTVQSGLLAEMVDRYQALLTGPLLKMIRLRQALAGKDTDVELHWEGANLQDQLMDAQAELAEEEAKAAQWEHDVKLWRQGFYTGMEVVRRHRPDLEGMTDEEIKAYLPDLNLEPPEAPAPTAPGTNPFTQANGANPGRNAGPNDNRAPSATRSLSYSSLWNDGNGNGHG